MEKKEKNKLNNSGLTIVELIIVLAIMAILGAVSYLSLSIATNRQVSSCAEKLGTSLEQTRNLALGKSSAYLEIWKDGSIYVQMYVNEQAYGNVVAIGVNGINVSYDTPSASGVSLGSTPVKLEFDRSSGGIKGSNVITSFNVTNGNRTCIVTIDKFTGRVSVRNA